MGHRAEGVREGMSLWSFRRYRRMYRMGHSRIGLRGEKDKLGQRTEKVKEGMC